MLLLNVAGRPPAEIDIDVVIVAGFTGRDAAEAHAHLEELQQMGVAVPANIPTFYVLPAHLLSQTDRIAVTHDRTSGEAEVVLVADGGELFVTLGSDHTDRATEARDIERSKLACPKIIAEKAWPMRRVRDHWDRLLLRSWIQVDGRRVLYQEGALASLLPPEALLQRMPFQPLDPCAIFTGTLPTRGGIRSSRRFTAELWDPENGDSINLGYDIMFA